MNKRLAMVSAVIAAQCIFLLGMTLQQERGLATDTTILLETRPVDPRDLLRGDYVILSYVISDVPVALFSGRTSSVTEGSTVYVRLARRGEFHEPVEGSSVPLEAQPDTVVIKGTMVSQWGNDQGTVRIHYGLEKYFVPEGTGNPRGTLTVEASVNGNGRAQIRQVFIDGKPYRDVMSQQQGQR